MKLSYLITVHNETDTLDRLITRVFEQVRGKEDEIVILDDFSDNPKTIDIIMTCLFDCGNVTWYRHKLNNDYGAHKNFGNQQCTGDWIFQIDGDELPSINLLENIKEIIDVNTNTQNNADVELIYVPRINDFKGVTEEHAKQWGWRLTESITYKRPIISWPDYQSRIYKNVSDRIVWKNKLHETITGHKMYSFLPSNTEDYALYHDKTIEKQVETNLRYNRDFSEAENRGISDQRII